MRKSRPLKLRDVLIEGGFWNRYIDMVRKKVLPYQWEALNDRMPGAARSHCIKNFEIAAGRECGEFYGMVFQDSDLYKWLESVAYSLETQPDPALQKLADFAVELIGAAQGDDGYINTYFTIKEPGKRWTNLQHGHELYCAGHLIEAAVAYESATGKQDFLEIAVRLADCIDNTFGPGEGRHKGCPGHQEIELALCKLYERTGEKRYLALAGHFIRIRGGSPNFFDTERQSPEYQAIFPELTALDNSYSQSHMPPVTQREAVGHAVRAVYMYSAMADLAAETGDAKLLTACDALYQSIVESRMYITGAIGSTSIGESFTTSFDLPDDLVYGETCASIGLMMFCRRMNALHGSARYADTMERALYNTVLAGISLAGTEFFYVNPLATDPARIAGNPCLSHVKPVRQKWFDCSCCPTNIARTVMGLGGYAYAGSEDGLYVNLYCSGSAKDGGRSVKVKTDYPYGGEVSIEADGGKWKLYLRDPECAQVLSLEIDGEEQPLTKENGYIVLERDWHGDQIELRLDMSPKYSYSSINVQDNIGKVAVTRGPLVYCAEQADNGGRLGALLLSADAALRDCAPPDGFPEWAASVETAAYRYESGQGSTYSPEPPRTEETTVKFIPYHLWANRGENEMRVHLNVVPLCRSRFGN